MSSLPHPKGVTEVIDLLAKVEALDAEASALRPKVTKAAERLKELDSQRSEERRRLYDLLDSMDVASPGNFGWERRMGWFLAEMRRQLTDKNVVEPATFID